MKKKKFLFLILFLIFSLSINSEENRKILVIAHRGVKKFAPENTLAAIKKAYEIGVDVVEIDLRTTADNKIILMHDSTVDRTTDGKGYVKEMTYEEIRKLDAGIKFSKKFKGEKVPSFEEVLKYCKGKLQIYIDVKDVDCKEMVKLIEKYNMEENVFVFANYNFLKQVKKLNKKIKILPDTNSCENFEFVNKILSPEAVELEIDSPDITRECIEEIQKNGVKVFMDVLGKNDNLEVMEKVIELQVDGIQTDNPDTLIYLLKKKKLR